LISGVISLFFLVRALPKSQTLDFSMTGRSESCNLIKETAGLCCLIRGLIKGNVNIARITGRIAFAPFFTPSGYLKSLKHICFKFISGIMKGITRDSKLIVRLCYLIMNLYLCFTFQLFVFLELFYLHRYVLFISFLLFFYLIPFAFSCSCFYFCFGWFFCQPKLSGQDFVVNLLNLIIFFLLPFTLEL